MSYPRLNHENKVSASMSRRAFAAGLTLLGLIGCAAGCREPNPLASMHEPNYLFAHSMEISQETEMAQPLSDTKALLAEWFGTVDAPMLPAALKEGDYSDLISEENLQLAAGSAGKPGLYVVQQCASCHGLSGQGRGPVAASQDPYPRDFRAGIFKFKSTSRGAKPLKEDLARVLREGLSGSQMPIFDKLSDQEIGALVDYVVFLSIRGEFERKLLQTAAIDAPGERLYDVSGDAKVREEQQSAAAELLTQIADRWVGAEDAKDDFPLPDFPLVGSQTDENKDQLLASIAKGKELFAQESAACSKCHGVQADGKGGQLPDYDDWTKEWTTKIGLQPTDTDALIPLMARGGMKPQTLKPRNIVEGHLRGGRNPIDIYRRIRYGIAGSPMPAASIAQSSDEPGLQEDDLWHLVNYVLSIAQVPPKPVSSTQDSPTVSSL
jgi:mono/diheme cytochrome c family protein